MLDSVHDKLLYLSQFWTLPRAESLFESTTVKSCRMLLFAKKGQTSHHEEPSPRTKVKETLHLLDQREQFLNHKMNQQIINAKGHILVKNKYGM